MTGETKPRQLRHRVHPHRLLDPDATPQSAN